MAEAGRIDAAGFATLWANDHFVALAGADAESNGSLDSPIFECMSVLTGFAQATERVTLGTLVAGCGYRNVGLLAQTAVTIDHASRGRMVAGIGAGWYEREHDMFGFELPAVAHRLDRLAEHAAALRALLGGEEVTRNGEWVQLRGARLSPGPYGQRIPLLVGGSGPRRTLPIVARWADWWNGEGAPDEIAAKLRRLDALCSSVGRRLDDIIVTVGLPPPLVRDSASDAVTEARAILAGHGVASAAASAMVAENPCVGTVNDLRALCERYRDVGVDHLVFDWPAPFDGETRVRLADEICPALSGA
jgi:alkanesulfonate monooxygenase SsuD/methylene tetrahydromethanopterin reductase-like flavin-dependent oxidoreductase (luciferase family)